MRTQRICWLVLLAIAACRVPQTKIAENDSPHAISDGMDRAARTMANPEVDELAGQDFYTCCNLRFNSSGDAYDANYFYTDPEEHFVVPAGTRVHIKQAKGVLVALQPIGGPRPFYIQFSYGRRQVRPGQFFRNILLQRDPREDLVGVAPEIMRAIDDSRLIPGMTKEQALMARGYPPFHRTAGVAADTWLYYRDRDITEQVRFVDGRIQSVETRPAP